MTVPAAHRTLDIIEAFARAKRPLTVSALAAATGIPMSSCHGLVKTLESRGYLFELKEQGGFYFTKQLARQAADIGAYDPLPAWIAPALTAVRDRCNETVVLGKLVDGTVLYVEVLESKQSVRYILQVGDIRPLHASAVGKALLASLSEARRLALIERMKLTRYNDRTIVSKTALIEHIEEGARRGWFGTRAEYQDEVNAVAVPVMLGGEHYACGIAGPSHRMEENQADHIRLIQSFGPALAGL